MFRVFSRCKVIEKREKQSNVITSDFTICDSNVRNDPY